MALHIRDIRQSDAAELTRLGKAAHWLGPLPSPDARTRILVALRGDRLAGAIWFALKEEAGIISCITVAQTNGWHSDVQELLAEASLWLSSRGAAHIDLMTLPTDQALVARLLEMNFNANERAGTMCRLVPARGPA